ncbi:hypothetical protein MTR67_037969 [Solanum verrucosum]|uniref:Mitochondrial protein n=1 Tax=Solanum verrucosum TaxID=315347 RepID=A0AAF0ZPS9_SOLVR|nr:hypothetical protein MTR67_037969 [Solanum verrucosum]
MAYFDGIVSQFMQCPRSSHLDAARRILRYVKSPLDYGLMYIRHEKFVLNGFIDADWAEDTNDRHSTSGSWFLGANKKQQVGCDNESAIKLALNPIFHGTINIQEESDYGSCLVL